MIPLSRHDRKETTKYLLLFVVVASKNDCTNLLHVQFTTEVLTAVQYLNSPFISMSIPIQFEHLKLWQNIRIAIFPSHFL
jgi:hypothetical protein